jgi:hypothetical protein
VPVPPVVAVPAGDRVDPHPASTAAVTATATTATVADATVADATVADATVADATVADATVASAPETGGQLLGKRALIGVAFHGRRNSGR